MKLVCCVLVAIAAIQGQVYGQTATTAAGSTDLSTFLANLNNSIQNLEPVISTLLNIDSAALATQFKSISSLINSIPVTIQNISTTIATQQNPSLDSLLKITGLLLQSTENLLGQTSDISTNITSIFANSFDTTIKKVIQEIDSGLTKIVNGSLSTVLNGALADCVTPMSDIFNSLFLGLNSGLQTCIKAELNTLNGFLVQINGIVKSLHNIVTAADTSLASCKTGNIFCLQTVIASITVDGIAIPAGITKLTADITDFTANIQTRFTACLATNSAASIYQTTLLLPNILKCIIF